MFIIGGDVRGQCVGEWRSSPRIGAGRGVRQGLWAGAGSRLLPRACAMCSRSWCFTPVISFNLTKARGSVGYEKCKFGENAGTRLVAVAFSQM